MLATITKTLLFILVFSTTLLCQAKYIRSTSLPWEAQKLVNKEFGYWDYFNSSIPYMDTTGIRVAWEYADQIKGDFNTDSKDDYALLVKPYDQKEGYLVVLIHKENSFELIKLEKIQYRRDRVLFLSKKGTKEYDYESEGYFEVPSDGITISWYEKAGYTHYMINGRFSALTTSD